MRDDRRPCRILQHHFDTFNNMASTARETCHLDADLEQRSAHVKQGGSGRSRRPGLRSTRPIRPGVQGCPTALGLKMDKNAEKSRAPSHRCAKREGWPPPEINAASKGANGLCAMGRGLHGSIVSFESAQSWNERCDLLPAYARSLPNGSGDKRSTSDRRIQQSQPRPLQSTVLNATGTWFSDSCFSCSSVCDVPRLRLTLRMRLVGAILSLLSKSGPFTATAP